MPLFVIGAIGIVLGAVGLIWMGRRAFYRRNMAGVEEFKNYTSAVTSAIFEKTIRAVSIILLVGGLFLVIMPMIFM